MNVSGDEALINLLNGFGQGGEPVHEMSLSECTDAGVESLAQSRFLSQVQSLRLTGFHLTDVGVLALSQSPYLTNLQSLELIDCDVTDACAVSLAQILKVANLRSLSLINTSISDVGLKVLVRCQYLIKLRELVVGHSHLIDEQGSPVFQVTDAGVEALAESPNIRNLKKLDLCGTGVTLSGVWALAQSAYAAQLEYLATDIAFLTLITNTDNAQAIFSYLHESHLGGPLLEVKVPILGMGALGKSVLSRRLSGDKKAFKNDNPATHDFEVHGMALTVARAGQDHECTLRLFDFGGQPELHGIHRFFLADQRNVYIIVISSRLTREENRLDYWLRMVSQRGGTTLPVVVVVSHCDDKPVASRGNGSLERRLPDLDATQLSDEHKLSVQVVDGYSNVNGANIDRVRDALQRAVVQLNDVFLVSFPPGFFDVRNCLNPSGRPPSFRLRYDLDTSWTVSGDFRNVCNAVGQKNFEQQKIWLRLLRDLGYVLYVGDRVKNQWTHVLYDYIFQPEWVKEPIYKVIHPEDAKKARGIVFESQIKSVLRQCHIDDMDGRRVLALMLECNLIFQVRGKDPEDPNYLIPDQVGTRPPEFSFDWVETPSGNIQWRFRFLPDHLLAQLAGRWFNDQPEGFAYFRDAVVLAQQGRKCRVRLQADFNAHVLDLDFDVDSGVSEFKGTLEAEISNLLDPEGWLPKPLWEEYDATKPPNPIVECKTQSIAGSLPTALSVGAEVHSAMPEKLTRTRRKRKDPNEERNDWIRRQKGSNAYIEKQLKAITLLDDHSHWKPIGANQIGNIRGAKPQSDTTS